MFSIERENVLRLRLLGHQKQGHVSNHFARGRDFYDIAKKLIHLGVHSLHLTPAMAQPQSRGLLSQVGVLATGNLVLVRSGNAAAPAADLDGLLRTSFPEPEYVPVIRKMFEDSLANDGLGMKTKRKDDCILLSYPIAILAADV